MFEIGFSELCMVALVALLVIGPEKLPKVARMTGFWLAKTRRTIDAVKHEIAEEFQAEELRQSLKNQSGFSEFQKILHDTNAELSSMSHAVKQDPVEIKPATTPIPKQDD
jgi:sec-independent protein translocase protein TatB